MTEKVFMRLYTEIVNGKCPTCEEFTMLVGITREHYRCVSCGTDLQQHVNGSIKYLKLDDKDREWLKENRSSEQPTT